MTLSVQAKPALMELAGPLVERAVSEGFLPSLFSSDHRLWGTEAEPESSIRLGWVQKPADQQTLIDEISALRRDFLDSGIDSFVLCGMGGSSLAPEVLAACDGVPLEIVDSTHPDLINRVTTRDLSKVAVIVSSKSGGTVETDSQRRAYEEAFQTQGIDPKHRIVVVTDPGSDLHASAKEAGYRVFLGNPHIGGRFSALSAFGLVPSGLAGVDIQRVLDQAQSAWTQLQVDGRDNPALVLGALIAARYPAVNKVLLEASPKAPGIGDWIEQLVAESTGKNGLGILPVVDSSVTGQPDCVSVGDPSSGCDITVDGDVGELMMLWMVATVYACQLLGVNPFDQPNVESAKVAARTLLSGENNDNEDRETKTQAGSVWTFPETPTQNNVLFDLIAWCQDHLTPKTYVALCIFADPAEDEAWQALRWQLESTLQRPVTLGFGPRFLHSTGQLHKGGPLEGIFVQFVVKATTPKAIPGRDFDFGQLLMAQARGDRQVLAESGQPTVSMVFENTTQMRAFVGPLIERKS